MSWAGFWVGFEYMGWELWQVPPPLIIFFVVWLEPRLLRVASLCVVVTLAVLNIYLFIYLQEAMVLTSLLKNSVLFAQ